jgi:hypothetical protein
VWDAAVPIMTSVNTETDPRRQMLISMLMTGSTDSAIANTLNINVRSVRRWISDLMDEMGVRRACSLVRPLCGQTVCEVSDHCKPITISQRCLQTESCEISKPRPRS